MTKFLLSIVTDLLESRTLTSASIEICFFLSIYLFLEYLYYIYTVLGLQVVLVVKNPSANAGDVRDMSSIPGSGRLPGGGHGNRPVFLSGESYGQRRLVAHSPWD